MTSHPGIGWVIAAACGLLVVGLIGYGRGPKHHRGNEIGSHGTKVVVVYLNP
jgi:hypothetical protein